MNLLTGRRPQRAGFALLLLAAGLGGCSGSSAPSEPPPPARIVELDEAGWEKMRERHRGRALLVNFWATWCVPCREEFPALVRLHQTYRQRGLSLVAVSMDEPESVPEIEKFLKEQGAGFGSYRHNFADFGAFVDRVNPRWIGAIPASFLYDREGKLVASWQGATTYEEFERAVLAHLPPP
jgi:thiol-disulfide isomerase/thioredoxin